VHVRERICFSTVSSSTTVRIHTLLLSPQVVAQQGVAASHTFLTSILHVWCETARTASILQQVYPRVAKELDTSETTVVVLTVAEGQKARPIFYENVLWNRGRFGVADLALAGQTLWLQSKAKTVSV
jgi:hypothetical protein